MTNLDVCFLPAHRMLEMISKGEISAVELLDCHLDQITKINGKINFLKLVLNLMPIVLLASSILGLIR